MVEICYVFATGAFLLGPADEVPSPGLWVCREHHYGHYTGHYVADHVSVVRRSDVGTPAYVPDWLLDAMSGREGVWVEVAWAQLPTWEGRIEVASQPPRLIELGRPTAYTLA